MFVEKRKSMKRLKLISIAICLLMASCIPSLHPIYTDSNKHFDNRIIGNWSNKSKKSKEVEISIEAEDLSVEEIEKLEEEMKDDGFFNFDQISKWRFVRAANLRYIKRNEDGSSSSISIDNQNIGDRDSSILNNGYILDEINELDYYILEYEELSDDDSSAKEMMQVNLTEINGELYMDFEPLPDARETSRFSINFIPAHTFAKVIINDDTMIIKSFDSEYIEKLIKSKRVRLKHELVGETIVLTASTVELRAFIEKYGNDEDLYLDDEILYALN